MRSVLRFQVYSRWGELVFKRRSFASNEQALGWDGRFRQREMSPGVFAWYAEFELINGYTVRLQGDLTLVR